MSALQITTLETSNANLRSENTTLLSQISHGTDPNSTLVITNLRIERDRLISSEASTRSKLVELERKQATLVQTTAAQTFKNCEEGYKRELALKGVRNLFRYSSAY